MPHTIHANGSNVREARVDASALSQWKVCPRCRWAPEVTVHGMAAGSPSMGVHGCMGPSLPLRGGHPRERAGQGSDGGARSTFCNWHRLGPFEGEFAWSCPDRHCAREVTLHGSVDGSPVMGFGYLGRGAEPIASKEPGGCQPSGEL